MTFHLEPKAVDQGSRQTNTEGKGRTWLLNKVYEACSIHRSQLPVNEIKYNFRMEPKAFPYI